MSKKALLIIVEGPSDKISLEGILNAFLTDAEHLTEFITYESDILTSKNPIKVVKQTVQKLMGLNGLVPSDIQEIIIISDMDGCYISNSQVIQVEGKSITYNEITIECSDAKSIMSRNKNKRSSIDCFLETPSITINQLIIPLHLYYFSCNLDHVLHDKKNLQQKKKIKHALLFASQYKDNEQSFLIYINPYVTLDDYDESWEFIEKENHSLERFTNINILLSRR